MKTTALFCSLFLMMSSAQAKLEFPIGGGETLQPFPSPPPIESCSTNPNKEQVQSVQEHLQAINQAIKCSNTALAREITKDLLIELETDEVSVTPMGICYDDRKCKSPLANNLTTKDMCKAANGKSWAETTPNSGACELIR